MVECGGGARVRWRCRSAVAVPECGGWWSVVAGLECSGGIGVWWRCQSALVVPECGGLWSAVAVLECDGGAGVQAIAKSFQ